MFCLIVLIIMLILWIKSDYNDSEDRYTFYKHPKTWFIDIDGVIFEHNGIYEKGFDTPIKGSKKFLDNIPQDDIIILTTARTENIKERTLEELKRHNIRYNQILFGMNIGKRILINDRKPDGMVTAFSFSPKRNYGLNGCDIG